MGEPALQMRGICKAFPGTVALRDVSFSVAAGEIRALIGANGAGKSTLMNVLVGVHQRDAGEITVRGERLEHTSPPEALRRGIAFVPQELSLVPELSVAENVFLGNFVKGRDRLIDWRATQRRAEELLAGIGVHLDVTGKLGKLSAAYQQLVSIARALAFGSHILILDEPTAALSAHEAELLFAVMRRLRESGTAIVFITHHLDEVKEVADGLTIMRDGQVVFDGAAKDLPIPEIIFHMANRRVEFERLGASAARSETFLEARGLSRKGEFEDVSFSVRKGEILGIAGLVGAGRTELCNALFGVTRKDAGTTLIDGKEVDIDGPRTAIAQGLGYVPEERRRMALFSVLSVLENMLLPSFARVSSRGLIDFGKCETEADGFVADLSIKTPSVVVPIRSLSGGNQQKVVLARWIAMRTRMLILDEPTRGIDVNAKGEIHKLIRKLAEQGLAVIVVSSEAEEILALADRIMVMHEGRVRGFLEDPRNSSQEDILAVAMATATQAAARYQPRKQRYRLAFVHMLTHPWYDAIRAGAAAAVESYAKRGVTVEYAVPGPARGRRRRPGTAAGGGSGRAARRHRRGHRRRRQGGPRHQPDPDGRRAGHDLRRRRRRQGPGLRPAGLRGQRRQPGGRRPAGRGAGARHRLPGRGGHARGHAGRPLARGPHPRASTRCWPATRRSRWSPASTTTTTWPPPRSWPRGCCRSSPACAASGATT